ncbi:MAG: hypothetical protein V7K26_04975 [Nostoc sp.]|uniref:hypothetical protein n=2 Tax=Nostoc sp. TaxID=1180 RepID=UPI002FF3BE1D
MRNETQRLIFVHVEFLKMKAIALMILEELEDGVQWDKTFAKSQNFLAKVAGEAVADYRAGKTKALDPDTL